MAVSSENKTYTEGIVKIYTVHDAVTADATSDAIDIMGAKKVMLVFTATGISNRQADLTVDVSGDGSTFVDYNMLIDNVTNTNSQQLTRIATKNRSATGTDILWMTPETLGAIAYMKVALDVTDGASPAGNFTVKVIVQF